MNWVGSVSDIANNFVSYNKREERNRAGEICSFLLSRLYTFLVFFSRKGILFQSAVSNSFIMVRVLFLFSSLSNSKIHSNKF